MDFIAALQKGEITFGPAPDEISPARIEIDFPRQGGITVLVVTRSGAYKRWQTALLLSDVLGLLQTLTITTEGPGHAEIQVHGPDASFFVEEH